MGAAARRYSRFSAAAPKYPVRGRPWRGLSGLGKLIEGGVVSRPGVILGGVISYFLGQWAGKKWGKTDEAPRNWGIGMALVSVVGAALTNRRSTGHFFPSGILTAPTPTATPVAMALPGTAANGTPAGAASSVAPVVERPNGAPPLPQDFFTHPGDALAPLRSAMFGLMQGSAEFGGPPPEDQLVRYQALIEEALPAARASSDPQAASLVADAEQMIAGIMRQLDPDEGTGWYEQ